MIGPDVSKICGEIKKMGSFSGTVKSSNFTEERHHGSIEPLGVITTIFHPIFPAICEAGMTKVVVRTYCCTGTGS